MCVLQRPEGVAVATNGTMRYTAWLRALLLGMVAFGVFNMHSLGHAGPHDPLVIGGAAAAAADRDGTGPAGVAERTVPAPEGDTCPAGACAAAMDAGAASEPGRGGHGRTVAVLIVCLAVLAGVGVLALLALRRRSVRARRLRPPWLAHLARGGPSRRPDFPLLLVRVAVLRT